MYPTHYLPRQKNLTDQINFFRGVSKSMEHQNGMFCFVSWLPFKWFFLNYRNQISTIQLTEIRLDAILCYYNIAGVIGKSLKQGTIRIF